MNTKKKATKINKLDDPMEVETEVKPASKSTSRKSVSNAHTRVREAKEEQVADAMETDELVVELASNLVRLFRVSKLFND